jgi:hypothetical protein
MANSKSKLPLPNATHSESFCSFGFPSLFAAMLQPEPEPEPEPESEPDQTDNAADEDGAAAEQEQKQEQQEENEKLAAYVDTPDAEQWPSRRA